MNEPRSIWLRTHNGNPKSFVWALTKLEVDCNSSNHSWECALSTADHPTASGWDATVTSWRGVPPMLYIDSLEAGTPVLNGRNLEIAGCTFNLDTGGRPDPTGGEALPPDTKVDNIADLVTHVEALGHDIDFIEKSTLRRCRVYTTEPSDPFASGTIDSAFYRQTSDGTAVRSDAS